MRHNTFPYTINNVYFNPRTHRGVRPEGVFDFLTFYQISIHAPIVGCDISTNTHILHQALFQSTHPSWGATRDNQLGVMISANFNPRTHRGVRRSLVWLYGSGGAISIHAPIVGCDCVYNRKIACSRISIHAPIVGCDWLGMVRFMRYRNFNPRTHRGVRLIKWTLSTRIIYFNPRTHRGVRLKSERRSKNKLRSISIHAPIVGCDFSCAYRSASSFISIHAPIVGCDVLASVKRAMHTNISIHAPIVGCDIRRIIIIWLKTKFQSTHPSWGAR